MAWVGGGGKNVFREAASSGFSMNEYRRATPVQASGAPLILARHCHRLQIGLGLLLFHTDVLRGDGLLLLLVRFVRFGLFLAFVLGVGFR